MPDSINDEPSLSVVLPWCEGRGEGIRHLDKWARKQTLPRGDYEMVVGFDREEPGAEEEIRSVLGEGDLAVPSDRGGALDLWDVAIRAARAEWIFVTELHCIPDNDTLEKVLESCRENEFDAFSVGTSHINRTDVAWMEEQVFRELDPVFHEPGQWNLLRLRGFAIRRDWVERLGGFETRYDLFAELVLSLELDRKGARVGLDSRARVHHINQATMALHRDDHSRFIAGEMRYRNENPEAGWLPYLGLPEAIVPLWLKRPRTARRVLPLLVAACRDTGSEDLREALGRRFPGLAAAAVFGKLPEMARLFLECQWREARFQLARGRTPERFNLYQEHADAYCEWVRLLGYGRKAPGDREAEPIRDDGAIDCAAMIRGAEPGDAPVSWLGFYGPEEHAGVAFRWGMPVSALRIPLAEGRWTIEVVLAPFRDPDDLRHLVAAWEGKPREIAWTSPDHFEVRNCAAEKRSRPGELTLFAPPLRGVSKEETRELAVPVRRISWSRDEPERRAGATPT